MLNHKNSPLEPASSGGVSADFETFFDEVNRGVQQSTETKRAWEIIYFNAYLACYNRLMTTFRKSPQAIVEDTQAMREELINYLKID